MALDTNAETQAFSYDGLGRLTASDLPGTARDRAYAYDRNGNRTGATLGATVTTYAYDRSDALVSQSVDGGAAAGFGYDRSGNLTTNPESQAGATTSTYDLGDRLTGIDPPGQAATSFTFDALGRHRTRVTPAGSDTYDYVGAEELVWRITTGAASVTSAIDAAGNRAATASGGATGYLVPDLHGNFAAALSPAGTVINAIRYDGYGVTLDEFGSSGIATPWRFQGRLDLSPDPATPLYDLSARNYSPGLGAFTSFDSVRGQIAEPLSMNRYLYAHASPSTLTDPTGQAVYMKDSGTPTQIRGGDASASSYYRFRVANNLLPVPGGTTYAQLRDVAWRTMGAATTPVGAAAAVVPVLRLGSLVTKAVPFVAAAVRSTPAFVGSLGRGIITEAAFTAGALSTAIHAAAGGNWRAACAVGCAPAANLGTAAAEVVLGPAGGPGGVGVGPIDDGIRVGPRSAAASGVAASRVTSARPPSYPIVNFDAQWASRELLGQNVPGSVGFATTPAGRTISAHAADRIANGGRGAMNDIPLEYIDRILDTGSRLRFRSEIRPGNLLLQSIRVEAPHLPGNPFVVVDLATGRHIVTAMVPYK